jgi:signal transduction histidine kinase
VLTASLRAKALVQQILTFSRRTVADQTPVSLAAILRETLPFLRALLPTTITLEAHLPTEGSEVLADVTQMHQIVMNLGTNAGYAMRDTGGRLEVRLEAIDVDAAGAATHPVLRPGPYVRLTVRDTGPGIPPDALARIYEPFFTTKEVGHGTGLGLSVVHGIVESHSGAILVESLRDQGTTFTIYLPRLVGCLAGDTPPAAEDSPHFDRAKYLLGKLCKRGHEWGTTGRSLLSVHGHTCKECKVEYKRRKRTEQLQPVQP